MNTTKTASVEPGHRIQLPPEWAEALGLRGLVRLDKTDEGILVRPYPQASWDQIFATKLVIGQWASETEDIEVGKDDLLF